MQAAPVATTPTPTAKGGSESGPWECWAAPPPGVVANKGHLGSTAQRGLGWPGQRSIRWRRREEARWCRRTPDGADSAGQTFWKGEPQAPYSVPQFWPAPKVAGMAQHRYRQERRGDTSLVRASVLHFWHAIRCRLSGLGKGGKQFMWQHPAQQPLSPLPPGTWPALTHFPVPECPPPSKSVKSSSALALGAARTQGNVSDRH